MIPSVRRSHRAVHRDGRGGPAMCSSRKIPDLSPLMGRADSDRLAGPDYFRDAHHGELVRPGQVSQRREAAANRGATDGSTEKTAGAGVATAERPPWPARGGQRRPIIRGCSAGQI